jgi:peptidoglycan/LPS O-acetylase OafA/YrhL
MYVALLIYGGGKGDWLRMYWQFDFKNVKSIAGQLLLIKRIPNDPFLRILPHDWTLSIEMAVSLLLPLLAIGARINAFLMLIIIYFSIKFLALDPFVFDFSVGVFIATYRDQWKLNRGKWLVLFCSVFVIGVGFFWDASSVTADHFLIHHQTWGLAGLMILLLNSSKLQKLLSVRPLVFIGKISYSFYLFHFVILLILSNLLSFMNSTGFLFLLIIFTVLISSLSYYLVEKPFIKLSHRLTTRLK